MSGREENSDKKHFAHDSQASLCWEREECVGWQSVSRREGLRRPADRRDVLRKEESRDKG